MNTENKTLRKRREIRERKRKEQRIGIALGAIALIVAIAVSSFLVNSGVNHPSTDQVVSYPSQPSAAIVDQLSLTSPNPGFVETAANMLRETGYTVDYYQGEEVTVEFYRNLPTRGYGIVILRTHSTATYIDGTNDAAVLFTSERFSETRYFSDRLNGRLATVAYSAEQWEKGVRYFGIYPSFVSQSMKGDFQKTVIIMMGCEGLRNTEMAKALTQKGGSVYIGWSGTVSAYHTDSATLHLLQHFLGERLTLKKSVQETFKEVGFDSQSKSLLIYYPLDAGEKTIEDISR